MRRRVFLAVAMLGVSAMDHANAHAVLVKSSPPHRAVLHQPPRQIELWFNERLEPAYAMVNLLTSSGTPVAAGPPNAAARSLTMALPVLAPGDYLVRFRVLSVDGHIVEGTVSFTVASPKNSASGS